jgi:hypothetical protein
MQAVKEVLLHAPDFPFLLHWPSGLLGLEAFGDLFSVLSDEDELGLLETMILIGLSGLHRHVAHLMSDTALQIDERVIRVQVLQEARVAVANDQLKAFSQKPPPLEVGQEAPPSLSVLYLGELEGQEFSMGLLLSRLLAMDPQGAQQSQIFI